MMTTQITFTTDEDLKKRAMAKAKAKGITLKSIMVLSLRAFVEGKIDLGIRHVEEPEVEELFFKSESLNKKSEKFAKLLSK